MKVLGVCQDILAFERCVRVQGASTEVFEVLQPILLVIIWLHGVV